MESADKKELLEELKSIAAGLKTRLDLLGSSGVRFIPKAKRPEPCASPVAIYDGMPDGFGQFAACPKHTLWSGFVFGCWEIGSAAAIWGAAFSGPCERPFPDEGMEQLGRMLNWLAGEIKAGAPDMEGFRLIATGKCLEGGGLSAKDASTSALPAIEGWLSHTGAKAVLLLGESAREAFMPGQEASPGKEFTSGGRKWVATLPPDEIAGSQGLKKEAHNHLKAFIRSILP